MMFMQNLFIHPWLVIETFKIRFTHKFDQVLVTLEVCREEDQMIVVVVREVRVLFEPAAGCHVGFAPDDRFDSGLFRFAVELDRSKHVAMIGHRDGRLTERLDLLHQGIDLIGAVEQAVLSVEMQMDELRCHGEIVVRGEVEVKQKRSRPESEPPRSAFSSVDS